MVIIGFGPAGQIAAQSFVDRDCQTTVIGPNRDGVRCAQQLSFQGAIGDATQNDVLEHVRVARAKAIVITVPHHDSAIMILEQVRQLAPQTHIVARSRYQMHTNDFAADGAHALVGDEEQVDESCPIISANGSTRKEKKMMINWIMNQSEFREFGEYRVRLLVAVILGGLLGIERELHGRWTGLRTHMMVSLGAAIFTIAALTTAPNDSYEVTRVIQGIAAAIGFRGAGTILNLSFQLEVKGLTTASSI